MLQNSYCGNIIYLLCQNFNRTTLLIYQTRLYKLQTRIIYFQTRINYIMGHSGRKSRFLAPQDVPDISGYQLGFGCQCVRAYDNENPVTNQKIL